MPELPEIEHLRRSLVPHLVGARLAAVDLRRADVVRWIGGTGKGTRTGGTHVPPTDLLAGCVVVELQRHGKNLAIVADSGAVLGVHLGMSGQMRVLAAAEDDSHESLTHVHCVWRVERGKASRHHGIKAPSVRTAKVGATGRGRLRRQEQAAETRAANGGALEIGETPRIGTVLRDDSMATPALRGTIGWSSLRTVAPANEHSDQCTRLIFRDPRRFGGLFVFTSLDQLHERHWNRLGPDALTIGDDELAAALAGTKRSIKAALLDQAVLAGVGNIYADEALFAAGIHPVTRADRLKRPAVTILATEVRRVLRQAVEAGGSTLRDYVDAAGIGGGYGASHRVYGRGGEPCLDCGRSLRSISIAQRTTVFCPSCQRRGGRT